MTCKRCNKNKTRGNRFKYCTKCQVDKLEEHAKRQSRKVHKTKNK